MATTKQRLTISVTDEMYRDIANSIAVANRKTLSQKIVGLVEIALNGTASADMPRLSQAEQVFLQQFQQLDLWGKETVRAVINTELARIEDDQRMIEKPEPKMIPLYLSPAAAGFAAPIAGEEFDYYELKETDPQGAVFAVRVSGDSMEPLFKDRSVAFCNKDTLSNGDIGVFCVNGESFIKQYYYDRMMRVTYLFSLNRERSDADIMIPASSNFNFVCLGRVITNRHFPIPGRKESWI